MRSMKKITILMIVLLVPVSVGFAYSSGGGLTYGLQYCHPELTNQDIGLHTVGGYGYGTSRSGQRFGGFGMALFSDSNELVGGIGGNITGHEFVTWPVSLAVNLWTGVGGAKASLKDPGGYLIIFTELNLELGIALSPWMQLVVFGAMQGVANIIPGTPFDSVLYYSPAWGFRLNWGSFR